jgi:AAA family ATP:ADP antiporter
MNSPAAARTGGLAGILTLITAVREGEAGRALLLTLNFFLLFTAYYMIKPVRESLILSLNSGAEIKSAAGGIQAVLFMALVPAYGALANRFTGRGILIFIYLFLASNLLVFAALGRAGFPYLGIAFFLWLGMFNLLIVSQTWSLCSDIYNPEQGKRLFPLIAVGATSGAVFGSLVLMSVIRTKDLFWPLTVAAVLLVACSLIVRLAAPDASTAAKRLPKSEGSPWKRLSGGFGLIFSNRYLMLVALFVLLANFVNTNSEYMLGKLVAEHAKKLAASGLAGGASPEVLIGAFYGNFLFWVSIIVLILQLFVVSRVVRHFGIRTALLAVPVLALFSYSIILFLPILPLIRVVKIMENSTDYSLNNTAREILFLPVSREEKYKAKFAVDTCFWRSGDALSTVAVLSMAGVLGLGVTALAGLNAILVIGWIYVVWRISARRKSLLNSLD